MSIPTIPYESVVPPSRFNWKLQPNMVPLRSLYTNKVQTVQSPAFRWKVSLSYEDLSYEEAKVFHQFLVDMQLAGRFFKCFHMGRPLPQTGEANTGAVTASGRTATFTSGGTYLQKGDMVGINGELKMVTSHQTGNTFTFGPPMRNGGSNLAIQTVRPLTTFFCTTQTPRLQFQPGNLARLSFEGIEVFQ